MSDDLYRYLDLRTKSQRRHDNNAASAARPVAGDFWHEMFSPVCVVLESSNDRVVICQKTKPSGIDQYEFDLDHVEEMPVKQFREMLVYSTMPDKFSCDCAQGRAVATAEAYAASKGAQS